jgi:predicted ribonuclease YlaK
LRASREVSLHPDMSEFRELDAAHADDRILATALVLAYRELQSTVLLITRDRNLADKARQFELPAVDVADV